MSKHPDLREFFDDWPYDPDDSVRLARGADGREIMQVRQPLGIEQYEVDGRPDGERPYGMESALEYHLSRVAKARAKGEGESFKLGPEECAELFTEGVLYYYRYAHFFQLKDWARTARDTGRNLRLFDFVHRHARREEDRGQLEQWRPYILRMNGVARAMIHLDAGRHDEALRIAREAIGSVEALPEMDNATFQFERQRSLAALRELAEQIMKVRPVNELERLQGELQKAVDAEHFERAAQLRDRIRLLRDQAATR
ncbi:MAG: UvrB/UvrC motif-containing protein [Verrucomicrobia bacterium]|nr:UvrB/UvrC motif-containing protein [Verrucomicrobiota bacterium]